MYDPLTLSVEPHAVKDTRQHTPNPAAQDPEETPPHCMHWGIVGLVLGGAWGACNRPPYSD